MLAIPYFLGSPHVHCYHDVFKIIAQAHPQLRKSERKVADYVLEHRAKIVQMRIVDLAAAAAVVNPPWCGFAEP